VSRCLIGLSEADVPLACQDPSGHGEGRRAKGLRQAMSESEAAIADGMGADARSGELRPAG
jgi:hypothetical protein